MFSPVVSVRSVSISVPDGKRVVFLSDVHLGYGNRSADRQREDRLLATLRAIAPTVHHLFIVGDLFDFWFDYGTVIPKGHVRTLAALHDLKAGGVQITYLMGNHDFGHATYFREELGIEVEQGDIDATIDGTRFYIAHGDGKAHNDKGYLVLRSVLRNRTVQWFYRMLHPNIGIGLAARTSHGSRDYTSAKDFGPHDGLRDFAYQQLKNGFDIVIMGHRHRVAEERSDDGLYVNLGDWLGERCVIGEFTPQHGFRLLPDPYISGSI
jgi:UDP-2,3-diacylglucosamine hydrolase